MPAQPIATEQEGGQPSGVCVQFMRGSLLGPSDPLMRPLSAVWVRAIVRRAELGGLEPPTSWVRSTPVGSRNITLLHGRCSFAGGSVARGGADSRLFGLDHAVYVAEMGH